MGGLRRRVHESLERRRLGQHGATQNNLGPNQYLLAVATEGRSYYLSGDSTGPVSSEELSTIEQQDIQPKLATEDWLGAVDAAADGLSNAVGVSGSGLGPGLQQRQQRGVPHHCLVIFAIAVGIGLIVCAGHP